MELNDCINFLLARAQNTVFQHFKTTLSEYGVTPVQYGILKCLWQKDEQTPTQIAENINLDGSTITGILDRMEKKGLLSRRPNPEDRRGIKIFLSDEGKKLQKPIEDVVEEADRQVLEMLSAEEIVALRQILRKIVK